MRCGPQGSRTSGRVARITSWGEACDPDEWRHPAIMICDGGDDYWGLEYDPATKTYSQLAFNGGS